MHSVFLAPHNDDEVLFGAFTLLRHKPTVIVCTAESDARTSETREAMRILDCEWRQWKFAPEEMPAILREIAAVDADHVFAPAPEEDGNPDHNAVGEQARRCFSGRLTQYLTYTRAGKSTGGAPVPFEPEWVALKLRALACYRSQHLSPGRVAHFLREQREYQPEAAAA